MADREQLELLASRLLDGELSPEERSVLDAALAADPALRETAARLSRVHEGVNAVAAHRLPRDFTQRIMQGIEAEEEIAAPVIRIGGWFHWAAAAAVTLAVGLLISASILNREGRPDGNPLALRTPVQPEIDTPAPRGPVAAVVAFSNGELELVSKDGRESTTRFEGELPLPAEVSAPADTYAVLEVKGGTAVLSPGASARLSDIDADGTPDFEPIDGDIYLEGGVNSRVGTISLSTSGGLTLRSTSDGYQAEPSHGITRAGALQLGHRQWAKLYGDMQVSDREQSVLDDWAIRGRADAIKLQVKRLLGERYERIPARHWEHFDKLLCGVLSRPSERATYAYMIRFVLKYNFFENTTPDEIDAWGTIAGILAEGTTDSDVPLQVRDLIAQAEEAFAQDPQQLEEFKKLLRESMER